MENNVCTFLVEMEAFQFCKFFLIWETKQATPGTKNSNRTKTATQFCKFECGFCVPTQVRDTCIFRDTQFHPHILSNCPITVSQGFIQILYKKDSSNATNFEKKFQSPKSMQVHRENENCSSVVSDTLKSILLYIYFIAIDNSVSDVHLLYAGSLLDSHKLQNRLASSFEGSF